MLHFNNPSQLGPSSAIFAGKTSRQELLKSSERETVKQEIIGDDRETEEELNSLDGEELGNLSIVPETPRPSQIDVIRYERREREPWTGNGGGAQMGLGLIWA